MHDPLVIILSHFVNQESYMRQPIQGERECARGSKCECMFIDPKCPFICVEFLTMQELSDRPDDNQLCVICSRYVCVSHCYLVIPIL